MFYNLRALAKSKLAILFQVAEKLSEKLKTPATANVFNHPELNLTNSHCFFTLLRTKKVSARAEQRAEKRVAEKGGCLYWWVGK